MAECFGIPLALAVEWLRGIHCGGESLLAARDRSREVVYIWHLESLSDYRPLLADLRRRYVTGCRAICARTKNPTILQHVTELGGRRFKEPDTDYVRFIILPEGYARLVRAPQETTPKTPGQPLA